MQINSELTHAQRQEITLSALKIPIIEKDQKSREALRVL
jgi:hypothetical protein